jgi:hypothetical protein
MSSAPAESRDEGPEPLQVDERRDSSTITFVSAESYPADDPVFHGTFPLTCRGGEWYI